VPEHYNDNFYDKLDDLNVFLTSTLIDMENQQEAIVRAIKANPQHEVDIIQSFLSSTKLAESIGTLDDLIKTIDSSLLETSKVYTDIGEMVQRNKEMLEECRKVIINILENLEAEKALVDKYEEDLLDRLDIKLSDVNIFLLDTFYS
jgi:hypothetical protein